MRSCADKESLAAYFGVCVELYFAANETPKGKKVVVFFSSTGGNNYSTVWLVGSSKVRRETMEKLSQALKNHFQPKKVVIAKGSSSIDKTKLLKKL